MSSEHHRLQIWILALWASGSIVAGSVLHSLHQPFAHPAPSVSNLVDNRLPKGWRVLHLLSPACGCSRRVADYLARRPPLAGATEQVIIVGAASERLSSGSLAAQGFVVTEVTADALARHGVRGVPLLAFISPNGQVAYAGGYGSGSYGSGGFEDAAIWHRLQAGAIVHALPILGCALERETPSPREP